MDDILERPQSLQEIVDKAVADSAKQIAPADGAIFIPQVHGLMKSAAGKALELAGVEPDVTPSLSPSAVIELYLLQDPGKSPHDVTASEAAYGLITYLQQFGYLPAQLGHPTMTPGEELRNHFSANLQEGEQA